jgi:hypothetical protein
MGITKEYMEWETWVNKEIVKSSGKPFKSGEKVGLVKELTTNPYSNKPGFLMWDGSIVDCHRTELNLVIMDEKCVDIELVETQSMLRHDYDMEVFVTPYHEFIGEDEGYLKQYKVTIMCDCRPDHIISCFDVYEEALEHGLQEAIKLIY